VAGVAANSVRGAPGVRYANKRFNTP